jgi:alpha-N-arabinofuranosidase
MTRFYRRFLLGIGCLLSMPALADPVLTVNVKQVTGHLAPSAYGLMTEEINHSYDGGLYAELIQNRTFQDNTSQPAHWSLVQGPGGTGTMSLDSTQPVAGTALTTCLKLDATGASAGQRVGVANDGYWGIPVWPSTTYRVSFYAKGDGKFTGLLTVSLESDDGRIIHAEADISSITGDWRKYTATLTTKADAPVGAANRLVISTHQPGTVWLNLVSLFPPTWHDRPNGNRPDLMHLLSDLRPGFLRFPGGNYLEGTTVETRFPWKKTLGALDQRPGHLGTWGYRSSDGLGLLEFLEWAEDVGAEPVLAVYAGFSLRNHEHPQGTVVAAGHDLQPFVQDALDEIEYVTGSVHTTWGARRAADGHPAPFKLRYVEIGNEDYFGDAPKSYEARFAQFYDAIKAAHPKLQCIATFPVGGRHADVVDEHYYRSPDEMALLAHTYDGRDRRGPKVFVGEWAAREKPSRSDGEEKDNPTSALHAAIADAAFLTGLERNADLVVMNCYAPLLVRIDHGAYQWNPDLIGYDALGSYGSPSYYIQKMFNLDRGDTAVKVGMEEEPKDFYYSATRDSKTGTVYLKGVNRASASTAVRVRLEGASVSPGAQAVVLTSANPEDTNTLAQPKKVIPVTGPLMGAGHDFSYAFPPDSATVLILPSAH